MEIIKTYIVMYKGGEFIARPVKLHETKHGNYFIDKGNILKSISLKEAKELLLEN
jgi:hypothetical protein